MNRQGEGRRIEDRELSPTSAGHPRCGVEDETEELVEEETVIERKSPVQICSKFASERRGRHRRGVQSSIVFLAGSRVERSDVSAESVRKSLERNQLRLETVKGVHTFS